MKTTSNDTGRKDSRKEFALMLHRNESIIYRLCFALGDHSVENAQDLFQDICLHLWEGWDKYKGQCKESTWVYKIATNTLKMSHRQRRKHIEVVPVDKCLFERMADRTKDSRIEGLYEIIDGLDPGEKRLVYLYLDGIPMKEISVIVGKSESAVKQKLHRTIHKIRDRYEN